MQLKLEKKLGPKMKPLMDKKMKMVLYDPSSDEEPDEKEK